jgi:hypothetical protein
MATGEHSNNERDIFCAACAEVLKPGPVSSCSHPRVEVGSNTSTIVLRVVQGDKK